MGKENGILSKIVLQLVALYFQEKGIAIHFTSSNSLTKNPTLSMMRKYADQPYKLEEIAHEAVRLNDLKELINRKSIIMHPYQFLNRPKQNNISSRASSALIFSTRNLNKDHSYQKRPIPRPKIQSKS